MAKNETRYLELNIPQEVMADTAEIINENQIDATILGRADDENCVTVGFDYAPEQRDSIMEIIELIDDNSDDDDEEDEDEEEEEEEDED
ncbi:MAG: hypothetical protein HYX39_08570 [Bacteroidetes bacterium]|nr:hypothetical protein [Bacteroidota bacterium]